MRGSWLVVGSIAFVAIIAIALSVFSDAAVVPRGDDTRPASNQQTDTRPIVEIGGVRVAVTLADTPEERSQGLSGRESLAEHEGMLFIFPEEGRHGFWMKDMRFSIDIIWLSSTGTVVHVEERASPESYPLSFVPENPARFVLEVPAGFARAHHIAVGSSAVLPE